MCITFLSHCRTFAFLFSCCWFCNKKCIINTEYVTFKLNIPAGFIHLSVLWFCLLKQQHLKLANRVELCYSISLKCVILSVYLQQSAAQIAVCIIWNNTQVYTIENSKLLGCKYKLPFFVFSLPTADSEGIIGVKWPCSVNFP